MSNYRRFGKFHTWLYRLSGGRLLGSVGLGRKVLLLSCCGRKTGMVRTMPLVYMAKDDCFVVYASNGGLEALPAWFLNLRANPLASVEVGRRRVAVEMHIAEGDEYDALLSLAHEYNPHWKAYAADTRRQIPLVVLSPVAA